jgi:hypothetical protein
MIELHETKIDALVHLTLLEQESRNDPTAIRNGLHDLFSKTLSRMMRNERQYRLGVARYAAQVSRSALHETTGKRPEITTTDPATSSPASSPAAERMRRLRKRRCEGFRCLRIELRETEIEALVDLGFLKRESRNDPNAIRPGLSDFLDQVLGHKGGPPPHAATCLLP